ncbi:hypothetical protein D3C71_1455330 [compost metagenome]
MLPDSALFSEVDDCSVCPLARNGRHSGYCVNNNDPNAFHPCMNMDYWEDKTIEEVVNEIESSIYSSEVAEDKRIEKERVKKDKQDEKTARAREARSYVYQEQAQINRIKKVIKANDKLLAYVRSVALANQMMYGTPLPTAKHPIEIENEGLWKRIHAIEKVKKGKLRQLRLSRN